MRNGACQQRRSVPLAALSLENDKQPPLILQQLKRHPSPPHTFLSRGPNTRKHNPQTSRARGERTRMGETERMRAVLLFRPRHR